MKKLMMFLFFLGVVPVTSMAQDDDMYFAPTKENKAKEAKSYGMPSKTYYSGSQRSVDDYNRRAWSAATPIDSAGNDIIDFSAVRGVYPDSSVAEVAADDYQYTRRMSRFDGYTPAEAYWDGYRDGRWMSPWRSSWYSWYDYDPWYWDSPWYYGGYYSWYSPWHYGYYRPWNYGYYGYYGPYWHGGGSYRPCTSRPIRRTTYQSGRTFGRTNTNNSRTTYNSNRSFGQPSRSSSSPSFGGSSHSSGSFGGGSSSGGGRSTSGGRSFGGRR